MYITLARQATTANKARKKREERRKANKTLSLEVEKNFFHFSEMKKRPKSVTGGERVEEKKSGNTKSFEFN